MAQREAKRRGIGSDFVFQFIVKTTLVFIVVPHWLCVFRPWLAHAALPVGFVFRCTWMKHGLNGDEHLPPLFPRASRKTRGFLRRAGAGGSCSPWFIWVPVSWGGKRTWLGVLIWASFRSIPCRCILLCFLCSLYHFMAYSAQPALRHQLFLGYSP